MGTVTYSRVKFSSVSARCQALQESELVPAEVTLFGIWTVTMEPERASKLVSNRIPGGIPFCPQRFIDTTHDCEVHCRVEEFNHSSIGN